MNIVASNCLISYDMVIWRAERHKIYIYLACIFRGKFFIQNSIPLRCQTAAMNNRFTQIIFHRGKYIDPLTMVSLQTSRHKGLCILFTSINKTKTAPAVPPTFCSVRQFQTNRLKTKLKETWKENRQDKKSCHCDGASTQSEELKENNT